MPCHLPAISAAVLLIALAAPAAAQAPPHQSAAANVRESKLYTELLRSNPSFRKKREAIECGPITDPQLHQSCIASFETYSPL